MGLRIFPWEFLEEILLLKEPWSFQKWLKLPACCPLIQHSITPSTFSFLPLWHDAPLAFCARHFSKVLTKCWNFIVCLWDRYSNYYVYIMDRKTETDRVEPSCWWLPTLRYCLKTLIPSTENGRKWHLDPDIIIYFIVLATFFLPLHFLFLLVRKFCYKKKGKRKEK